jgi:hypothetical protein
MILFFDSCNKKCIQNQLSTLKFKQSELDDVPYKGNEQLVFLSTTNGQTYTFTITGRDSSFDTFYENYYRTEENNHCLGNYYYSEVNKTSITPFNNYIRFLMDDAFHSPTNAIKRIEFSFDINTNGIEGFHDVCLVGADTLTSTDYSIRAIDDSLMIGPKLFHHVYELLGDYNSIDEYISLLFYSIKDGIVGFRTNKGKTWYLN